MRQWSVRQPNNGVMHDDHIALFESTIHAHEREIVDLVRHPKFAGKEDAQLFWLGRTDAERIAFLEQQIDLGQRCARNLRSLQAA